MERLSDVVRGRSINQCAGCKYEDNGFCWKLKMSVTWYIANDRKPVDCPRIKSW